jgi:AAA domain
MPHPGAIMTHDANSLVREHGVAHLRRVFDQAPMLDSSYSPEPARDDAANPEFEAPATTSRIIPPLKLTYFDGCSVFALKRSILKGIIACGETSAWIAPPGAGKSALLTEISVHCAAKIDWRGHKAKEACGVVIFALERGDLFKRRLLAYQQRDGLQGLPIAVADAVIDLLHPNCVDVIVSTIREAEQQFGCSVGLIGIDTYAKGIAANGGDEDKARDQNRAAANLRNVHTRLENKAHIALVGHTGKNEDRGARGSNAHLGDVDVMVQISGDTIKVAEVIKGNDQPERTLAEFKLEAFELGRDEDGDPITTSIVSTQHFDAAQGSTGSKAKKGDLAPIPKAALHALHECVADGPTLAPLDAHVPAGVTGVTLDLWRDRLLKLAIINAKGNHREQFKRIRVTLQNSSTIGIWDDFVWPVTSRHIPSQ